MSEIRPAEPHDLTEITHLLDYAFTPSNYESQLVQALTRNGRELLQWVMEDVWGVNGYACFSRAYQGGTAIGWHLAPLAISPTVQRRGQGTRLLNVVLCTPELKQEAVFVLGDPAFYMRFGFTVAKQPRCAFDETGGHFLARNYTGQGTFTVGYEPEFTELIAPEHPL